MLRESRQLVTDLSRGSRACRQLVTRKLATSPTSPRGSYEEVNDVTRKLRGTGPSGIWPLRHSLSFKVICDFLLVNKTDIHLAPFYRAALVKFFNKGMPLVNAFVLENLREYRHANIAITHTLSKTRFFGLHFCRRHTVWVQLQSS